MISNNFKRIFDRPLSSLAKTVNINPTALTLTGLLITITASVTIPKNLFLGGALIAVGGFFDMFDGISARVNKRATEFGAFLDSVIDRYSDSFLFLGFAWHFHINNLWTGVYLSLGSLVGALLISYTRARSEGLGRECKVGIMERPERIILMILGALTGLILPVMWLMFILVHITVIQRIHHVWKVMK